MTYESLRSIFLFTGIASLILAVISVVLFFVLKIPDAIAFLSGYARRKGVRRIEKEGVNAARGRNKNRENNEKATMRKTEQKKSEKEKVARKSVAAGRVNNRVAETGLQDLSQMNPYYGGAEQTDVLSSDSSTTTVLADNHAEPTAQLSDLPSEHNADSSKQPFNIEFEITFLNSDIIIE